MSDGASASHARLETLGGDRFRVSGVIDASTATDLLERSRAMFANVARISVDLGGVEESDSAGLALLIEWVAAARRGGQQIQFTSVPAQINALAQISEVDDLLAGAEAAGGQAGFSASG